METIGVQMANHFASPTGTVLVENTSGSAESVRWNVAWQFTNSAATITTIVMRCTNHRVNARNFKTGDIGNIITVGVIRRKSIRSMDGSTIADESVDATINASVKIKLRIDNHTIHEIFNGDSERTNLEFKG